MYFFLAWKECWLITTRKLPVTVAEVKTIFTLKFAGHRSPHRAGAGGLGGGSGGVQISAAIQCKQSVGEECKNICLKHKNILPSQTTSEIFGCCVSSCNTSKTYLCLYVWKDICLPTRSKYLWHSKIFVTLKNIRGPCWTSAAMRRGAGRGTPPPSPRGSRRSTPTSSSCTPSTPGPGRTSPRCRQGHLIYKYNVQFLTFIIVRGQRSRYILFNVLFTLDHQ